MQVSWRAGLCKFHGMQEDYAGFMTKIRMEENIDQCYFYSDS